MNSGLKKKPKVLVVAHDAGGAELIAAYVRAHKRQSNYHIFAAGPATRVFLRNGLTASPAPRTSNEVSALIEKNKDAAFALLGSGWMTHIEWDALLQANKAGVHTIVYLDSWINFREVFGYPKKGWRKNIPDELWVADKAAFTLAKRFFPNTPVRLVKNQYFVDVIARYKVQSRTNAYPRSILFMSAAGRLSERIFGNFIADLSRRGFAGTVRVRLHPADDRICYEKIIRKKGGQLKIELSRERDIVRDLLRARIVVGPETVALVPAVMVGIRTIRIVPTREKPFLPFPSITLVKSPQSAANLIYREIVVA